MTWFNPAVILSYNRLINIVVGMRGGGKTFNTLKMCASRFKKSGSQFMYVRRYDVELESVKDSLFSDIKHKGYFPDDTIVTKGREILFNDDVMGYCVSLSTSRQLKSKAFPKVDTILFDEFLLDKGRTVYLKDEVKILLDLIETVGRMENIRVIMLANSITVSNLYFEYWDIRLPRGAKIIKHPTKPIVVQVYTNEEFTSEKMKTQFGQLIQGTSYAEYSIHNKFVNDNYEFIEAMQGSGKYLYTMSYEGKNYGVYWQEKKGIYHINTSYNDGHKLNFCFTTDDHKPNYILFKSAKMNPFIKQLLYALEIGRVRFDSLNTKNAVYSLVDYL